jgi:hypothetical protein
MLQLAVKFTQFEFPRLFFAFELNRFIVSLSEGWFSNGNKPVSKNIG